MKSYSTKNINGFNLYCEKTNQVYKTSIIKNGGLLALSLTTSTSFALTPVQDLNISSDRVDTVFNKEAKPQELLIIDSRIKNIGDIIHRRRLGLIPIVVNENEDGLSIISQAILDYPNAKAIHVVSHGQSGKVLLGKGSIDEDTINTRTGAIEQWQGKDKKRPDLIIYGCNVAQGQSGQSFINKLSAFTGFDVAASTNVTGQSDLGGDWVLEANTGWIDASLAWQTEDITQIKGVLATITVNSLADAGVGSLRDALATINNGDTINFSVTGTILLSSGQLVINNDVTITGPGSANLSIDANNNSRVLQVYGSLNVDITGVTITGGNSTRGAGVSASYNYTTLSLDDVTITGNSASVDGGGIYIDGNYMVLNIVNSTISNNSSGSDGGGIRFGDDYGYLTIDNSIITGNSAVSDGGGVYVYVNSTNPTVSITNSTISNNTANSGGGIMFYSDEEYDADGSFTLDNVIVTGNQATGGRGGGLSFEADYNLIQISINNSTISNNTSSSTGGGLNVEDDYGETDLTISNTTISNNTASRAAGAYIYKDDDGGITTIINSTISGNTATAGNAGGLSLDSSLYNVFIRNTTITNNNSSYSGGGIYSAADVYIENSIIAGNTAALSGNDVLNTSNNFTISNSLIADSVGLNTFSDGGGNLLDMDPLLQPLQNNGGLTQTHLVQVGSPVIDAGDSALIAEPNDQRGVGFPRVDGVSVDMGSTESSAIILAPPALIPTLSRWSLLLLGLILPAFAMQWLRDRRKIKSRKS